MQMETLLNKLKVFPDYKETQALRKACLMEEGWIKAVLVGRDSELKRSHQQSSTDFPDIGQDSNLNLRSYR